jgi:hypothetical protein
LHVYGVFLFCCWVAYVTGFAVLALWSIRSIAFGLYISRRLFSALEQNDHAEHSITHLKHPINTLYLLLTLTLRYRRLSAAEILRNFRSTSQHMAALLNSPEEDFLLNGDQGCQKSGPSIFNHAQLNDCLPFYGPD